MFCVVAECQALESDAGVVFDVEGPGLNIRSPGAFEGDIGVVVDGKVLVVVAVEEAAVFGQEEGQRLCVVVDPLVIGFPLYDSYVGEVRNGCESGLQSMRQIGSVHWEDVDWGYAV